MIPLSVIVSQIKQRQNLVTLPKQRELARRLRGAGFERFKRITHIDKELAEQTLSPDGIAAVVEAAIHNYDERSGNYEAALQVRQQKDQLFEAILEDYPLAIARLQSNGVMKAPSIIKNDVESLRDSHNAEPFWL